MQKSLSVNQKVVSREPNLEQLKFEKRNVFLSRLKRKILKHTWVVRSVILVGVFVALFVFLLLIGQVVKRTKIGVSVRLLMDFVATPAEKIKSVDGLTNILILGKGGGGHEAPDLTDTMIFASITHKEPSIKLISLPRDIWIPELRTKLNSAYYWGNQKEEGGGVTLAKATVSEIVGQPVHYAIVLDFSGFRKIIDVIGGVEVNVETSFTDPKYPIPGREADLCGGDPELRCRYETIKFESGGKLMDGETALKFVRSRNAQGNEGTDFARQVRQQKVIEAIKSRVLSREVLLSPKRLSALKKAVLEAMETDLDGSAFAILARRGLQSKDNIASFVLPEELLENPPHLPKYDNLYVFVPKAEDWSQIHRWVKEVLE